MKKYCYKKIGDRNCLRLEGHEVECSDRQEPVEPPLNRQLQILELLAEEPTAHLWSRIWTFADGGWLTWMADAGLITEDVSSRYNTYQYGGFSWADMAPRNSITEKGRALLAHHAPVEW